MIARPSNRHLASLAVLCLLAVPACSAKEDKVVVVYTSVDQVYSEPVLRNFGQKTGIRVNAAYDVEASKTAGLVNRLIAERDHPQADVFWNSEICRTIVLQQKGVLAPYGSPKATDIPARWKDPGGYWTGFAARARVLLYNTDLVPPGDAPRSIFDLTDPRWKGQAALAYPLFGTTATHMAALRVVLGEQKADDFFRALHANAVVIVDGNSMARDKAVAGTVKVALTDTDDAIMAIRRGKPVKMVFPDENDVGTLVIPHTVALIAGSPHPREGKLFIDYLLSREVEAELIRTDAGQFPVRAGIAGPLNIPPLAGLKAMEVNFAAVTGSLDATSRFLQDVFVR